MKVNVEKTSEKEEAPKKKPVNMFIISSGFILLAVGIFMLIAGLVMFMNNYRTQEIKRLSDARKNGYKIISDETASGDALKITTDNVKDYDIIYDDKLKIVRITRKDKDER